MKKFVILAAAALASVSAPAMSAVFVVDAFANSSSGGTGLNTGLVYTAGSALTVSASTTDLWNAGPLPRWSNADGLTGNLFATGSDESGQSVGTLIGSNFGTWSQNGLSAPYGSLVGELGGIYKLLGTNYNSTAWANGTLRLFYWDSNNSDNTNSVAVTVGGAVPEPASWAMMISGLAVVGAAMRRRKVAVSFA